ncbi:nardilysin-like [Protobothrops mucrosquamatus]|uniref:nardilysin-like n=1 Tax=Protobothrops mucrosquamatus TaxID=103944 RepID=UPI0010FB2116|nr:nardilysin-like [Protobothrops mucrosquamatus]
MSGETRTKGAENCPVIRSQQQRPQRCRNERAQHAEELRKRRAKKNEGDPDIVKSPSDHKEYRHIKLKNGMNVLLISDWTIDDCTSSDESDTELEDFLISSGTDEEDVLATKIQETERNDRNIKESEDGSLDGEVGSEGSYDFGSDGIVEGDREVREDHDDPEIYEELVKQEDENKMGSTEKQAAAALAVGVGSFCDPGDLPGLAHFLEHMVFMGSQKYPDENGFDTFLKKHGGSDNASTDTERTIFQFDIQKKYFKEALDRWAQFFIHPLMIKDAIDREVEAVDSEYQIAKPSDANRRELLLGSLAKPGHPMRKFFWGNAETLKYAPKKKGIDTYARLRDFRKRYYSAHYMNLVVQSRETLDTLQKWVTEIFSHIPDNGLPRPDFSHLINPFDTLEFHKVYKIIPVKEIHSLNISWGLPTQEKNYK